MSYCRWSSEDFQCDLYVWADVRGDWVATVATRRRVYTEPLPEPVPDPSGDSAEGVGAWLKRAQVVSGWPHEMTAIGLAHDGEQRRFDTPGECADWLVELVGLGYRVPAKAIARLREEQAEQDREGAPW